LTWPTWTFVGPLTSVTLANSGRSFTLTRTLLAGESITVTTDPRIGPRAVDGTGASVWSSIAAPFDLWPLNPGRQSVTATIVGSTSASSATMTYEGRWNSGLPYA